MAGNSVIAVLETRSLVNEQFNGEFPVLLHAGGQVFRGGVGLVRRKVSTGRP